MAVAAFLVIGATRQTQQQTVAIATEEVGSNARFEMLARNAALYGNDRARQGLNSSFTATSYTGDLDAASYTATVTVSGNVATIRSRGYVTNAAGEIVEYKVVEQIEKGSSSRTIPSLPPAFLRHSLLVDNNLSINGGILIDTFRVSGQVGRSTASIHTNGSLTSSGNSALIRGFGTYVNTQSVNTNLFKPYNPSSLPVVSKVSDVALPAGFAGAITQAAATADRTTVGTLTLNGTYDFTALGATRDNPYTWYVAGPITVSGSASIKGYVQFITLSDITFSGNISSTLTSGYAESNVAWYTNGDISLSGNSTLWGQFYAAGNVNFSGSVKVYGNVTTAGSLSIGGNPSVYTISASPALTGIFEGTNTNLSRLSYSEGW